MKWSFRIICNLNIKGMYAPIVFTQNKSVDSDMSHHIFDSIHSIINKKKQLQNN